MYHLIPNQLTSLYKQKDNGNKINIQMLPTENSIKFDESHSYP